MHGGTGITCTVHVVSMSIETAFEDAETFTVGSIRVTIDDIIAMAEATRDDQWQTETVRSEDGTRNCFFGHLYAYGQRLGDAATDLHIPGNPRLTIGETVANALWNWFEEFWATTFRVYLVNDGTAPAYQQPTPKARVIAFLHDLNEQRQPRTMALMELEAEQAGSPA